MALVVVGGSSKDVGKTALVCGVIAALKDFDWTAVKITGHSYEPATSTTTQPEPANKTIWEETSAGQETDTARYLAAGARRAVLVTRYGDEVQVDAFRRALGDDRNIIVESNRIIDVVQPDLCLALIGGAGTERKPSFRRLLRATDALVSVGGAVDVAALPEGIPQFILQAPDQLSPEMIVWLRARLGAPQFFDSGA